VPRERYDMKPALSWRGGNVLCSLSDFIGTFDEVIDDHGVQGHIVILVLATVRVLDRTDRPLARTDTCLALRKRRGRVATDLTPRLLLRPELGQSYAQGFALHIDHASKPCRIQALSCTASQRCARRSSWQ
jgi:hypothetical protein